MRLLILLLVVPVSAMAFDCDQSRKVANQYIAQAAAARRAADRLQKSITEQGLKQGPLRVEQSTAQQRIENLERIQATLKLMLPMLARMQIHLRSQLSKDAALQEMDSLLKESLALQPLKPVSQQLSDFMVSNPMAFSEDVRAQFTELVLIVQYNERHSEDWKRNQTEIIEELIRPDRPLLLLLLEEVIAQVNATAESDADAKSLRMSIESELENLRRKLAASDAAVDDLVRRLADQKKLAVDYAARHQRLDAAIERKCITWPLRHDPVRPVL